MNIKIYFSILFFSSVLISCERNVEFKGEVTNPLIVVNSFVTPDSTVTAYISMSRFFLKDSIAYRNANNADVNLWINGVFKEKLNFDSIGIYKGFYKPTISDQVKLTVDVPQMKQVNAATGFTETPVILSVDTQRVFISSHNLISGPESDLVVGISRNFKINYKLKFNDNVNLQNYYRLLVGCVNYTGIWNYNTNKMDTVIDEGRPQYSNFNFTDVLSGNTKDPLADTGTSIVGELMSNTTNVYNVFSDEVFNGKTYSLKFSTNHKIDNYFSIESLKFRAGEILRVEVFICLQSLSKDYYLYLKTRAASSASNFFSEPVKVHNNVNGGIGILGSYTTSNIVKFDLP